MGTVHALAPKATATVADASAAYLATFFGPECALSPEIAENTGLAVIRSTEDEMVIVRKSRDRHLLSCGDRRNAALRGLR
jgi:hypothetical protein